MANNNHVKGTDKVLQKLKESVDNANYYEAHQMYRTVCRRYIKQKKYSNAVELLFSGAQTLLKHQQGGSGTDLALYMIEAYIEEQLPVTDESRSRIIQLLELFPPNEIGRKKFIDAAVSWSVKFGESRAGDPELHHYVDKNYSEAEPHFLAGTSESSKSYGKMLAEWSEKDQFDKSGLYIARAVLQSIKDAKISFDTFISSKQQQQSNDIKTGVAQYRPTITGDPIEIPIYSLPLLNFLQLLILTVQRDAADLFISLRNKYKSVLSIDQSDNLLNKIGDVFFNIKPQRPQQFNVFQDLMTSQKLL
ncbi:39_t:CDS:2 [Entrophospora sp. SA101]|nr:39_t:CDS:2 [Entrophospora sp. SA101]